jgi:hypothetical protein
MANGIDSTPISAAIFQPIYTAGNTRCFVERRMVFVED